MAKLRLYYHLSTYQRKRICRVFGRYGKRTYYSPGRYEVENLMEKLNLTEQTVRNKLLKERAYLVEEAYKTRDIK